MASPELKLKQNLTKRDAILSVFTGIYFTLLFIFHPNIINFFINRFGAHFQNDHEILTLLGLFLITPLAAGLITFTLNRPAPFSFDKTLLKGFIAAIAFNFSYSFPLYFFRNAFSLFGFIGFMFFFTLFSFIIAALMATLLAKILISRNTNPH